MVTALSLILLALLIFVGRDRGLQAFLTILMNMAVLGGVVVAITWGASPLLVGSVAGCLLTLLILFYQNGNNLKTRSAFGVIVLVQLLVLLAALLLCREGHASGYSEVKINLDDGLFLDGNISLPLMQVEIVVILLGLLGAVKDAAVAVTSAVYEVHQNNPMLEVSQLFYSGLKIGKEILGTTINTLFFACVGESLLLFHMICYWGYSFSYVLNSKALYQVFLFSGIAGLGCILAIPLAACVMSVVLKRSMHDTSDTARCADEN